jgi:hypothetical protein
VGLWDFLRDEQNREALRLVGAALAALVLAAWALYQELRTARRLREIVAEIDQLKAAQADIFRGLERTEQRHEMLFGVIVGKTVVASESAKRDERPDTSER